MLDVVGLRKRLQALYDETRSLAQQRRWTDHLREASLLLGCFEFLGWEQWISRILGRMAWSFIRTNEVGHARKLLAFSESHHPWQAAANYYWAGEYSLRANHGNWEKEFTAHFRRICESTLGIEGESDLALAVTLYKKLVEQESVDPAFGKTNNQSDLGRYLELRARLTSCANDFHDASMHYELAGLPSYASFTKVFYWLSVAATYHPSIETRLDLYKKALEEIANRPVFAEEDVKVLLDQFIRARIVCCELVIECERTAREPKRIEKIEEAYRQLHTIFFGPPTGEGSKPLSEIAVHFIFLSQKKAWRRLVEFFTSLDTVVCSADRSKATLLDECLNGVQPFLPSISFWATREEE